MSKMSQPRHVKIAVSQEPNAQIILFPISPDCTLDAEQVFRSFPDGQTLVYFDESTGNYLQLLFDHVLYRFIQPSGGWGNKVFYVVKPSPVHKNVVQQETGDVEPIKHSLFGELSPELKQEIDNNTVKIGNLSSEVNKLSSEMTTVSSRLQNLSTEMTTVSSQVLKLSTELTNVSSQVLKLSSDLTNVSSDLVKLSSEIVKKTDPKVDLSKFATKDDLAEIKKELKESGLTRLQITVLVLSFIAFLLSIIGNFSAIVSMLLTFFSYIKPR